MRSAPRALELWNQRLGALRPKAVLFGIALRPPFRFCYVGRVWLSQVRDLIPLFLAFGRYPRESKPHGRSAFALQLSVALLLGCVQAVPRQPQCSLQEPWHCHLPCGLWSVPHQHRGNTHQATASCHPAAVKPRHLFAGADPGEIPRFCFTVISTHNGASALSTPSPTLLHTRTVHFATPGG